MEYVRYITSVLAVLGINAVAVKKFAPVGLRWAMKGWLGRTIILMIAFVIAVMTLSYWFAYVVL